MSVERCGSILEHKSSQGYDYDSLANRKLLQSSKVLTAVFTSSFSLTCSTRSAIAVFINQLRNHAAFLVEVYLGEDILV